ncbi:inhibitor of nuclear factor kappa-B kinase-interacting protein isoform X1 [Labeo rohita]|uniref:inhibitor of nuclear factor kappa-B kinase-interacting protein isoform X1 n=1 Tax=Labeo rohita TaxID=84645 RepID=UPI0021E31EEF|nr:inhibitor of nuclear factor kappa-B kinase-interacting protein isoform X1 [Labeo rohita]
MQKSGVKQRQRSSNKPQNGEQRRTEDEEEKEPVIRASSSRFSPDVKLSVSLMCLTVSVIITWLHVEQRAKLAQMTEKYEYLYENSRSVQELEEKMSEVSQKLQASSSSSSVLKHTITSIHNTSDALQEEQDASSLRIHTLNEHMRSVTEVWQSGQATVSSELDELKTRSRASHSRVTEHINDAESLLRELNERLQEVQDGIRRNARVLDRTEEEDAEQVRNQLDWNERRVSRLQEQLQRLSEQGREQHQRLERNAPRAQRCQDTHLPAAEEAVRSMLKVRAQVSTTYKRLEELQLQVRSAEEQMKRTPDVRPAEQEDSGVVRDGQELNQLNETLTGE